MAKMFYTCDKCGERHHARNIQIVEGDREICDRCANGEWVAFQSRVEVVHSTNRFLWDSTTRKFIAEASDLGVFYGRIYADALDVGFALESVKTGEIAVFYLVETKRQEGCGGVAFWRFVPTYDAIRRCPRIDGVEVIIFND